MNKEDFYPPQLLPDDRLRRQSVPGKRRLAGRGHPDRPGWAQDLCAGRSDPGARQGRMAARRGGHQPRHLRAQAGRGNHPAPIGLAALDTNLRFLRINDRLAEINGISATAHIGKTVQEIAPSLEAQAREVTAEILRTGRPIADIEFSGETAAQPGVNRSWLEGWHPRGH